MPLSIVKTETLNERRFLRARTFHSSAIGPCARGSQKLNEIMDVPTRPKRGLSRMLYRLASTSQPYGASFWTPVESN